MTDTPANALSVESLDPPIHDAADGRHAEAILSVHEIDLERAAARFTAVRPRVPPYAGMSLAMVAPMLIAGQAGSRDALMALPINTRADALCALAVIEGVEDAALAQRLIGQLRLFLSAD